MRVSAETIQNLVTYCIIITTPNTNIEKLMNTKFFNVLKSVH